MWNEIKTVYWRVVGVLRLDPQAFAEIHADPRATYQAVAVVYISSLPLANQVPGGWFTTLVVPFAFIAWWVVAAFVIYWLASTFFTKEDSAPTAFAPVARGIGYAMAPRIFQIFLIIILLPFPLGRIIQFLSFGWMFAAMAVSTHIALGRPSYTRVTIIIALAMLPVIILEPFLLGGQG
jgi:hypothetical protein